MPSDKSPKSINVTKERDHARIFCMEGSKDGHQIRPAPRIFQNRTDALDQNKLNLGRSLLLLLLLPSRSLALLPLNLRPSLCLFLFLLLPGALLFSHSGCNIHALNGGLLLLLLLHRLTPWVERNSSNIRRGWLWGRILLDCRLLGASCSATNANHFHETGAGRFLSARLDTSRGFGSCCRRRRGRVRIRIPKVFKDINIIPRTRSDLGTIANLARVRISILKTAFEVAGRVGSAGILAVKLFLEFLGSLGHGRQVKSGRSTQAGGRSSACAGHVVKRATEGTEIAGGGGRSVGGVVP